MKGERRLELLMNYIEKLRRMRVFNIAERVESSIDASHERIEKLSAGFQYDLSTEGFIAFWSCGGCLISLSDSRLCFIKILNDGSVRTKIVPLGEIRDIGIDLEQKQVGKDDDELAIIKWLLFAGIAGAMVASMSTSHEFEITFEFRMNGNREKLLMEIQDAKLLKLIFAAMIRTR